jgi:uncharacterized protein YdhG (YjbR/CyaY superfamily)
VTPTSSSGKDAKAVASRLRANFAALSPGSRKELQKLRAAIRSAAPKATEDFSYGIPAFRLDGKPFVYYAAWARHCSLYPMTESIQRAFAADLEGYEMSKGTIRFPFNERLPVGLIKRMVKAHAAGLRAKAKRGAKRPS